MRGLRSIPRWLLISLSVAGASGYSLYQYRDRQIERLYAESAGLPPFFRGTTEAERAAKKLGTYRGQKVTSMLLNIALGRTPLRWPAIESTAIDALANRREPRLSESLAMLLQPQQPLPAREAAARALQKLPCDLACVESILHYLERISYGELNYEDRSTFPPGLSEGIKAGNQRDQEAVYQFLYTALRHERRNTLVVLAQVYGLGTDAPSKFALSLLSRMQLRDACPALLQSERLVKQSSAELFDAPRAELKATVDVVKCR
jgi:hypothetical protein